MVVVGLVWWFLVVPPSGTMPAIRALFLGFGTLFLPGYLLRRLIFSDFDWPVLVEIPLWFGLSLGICAAAWLTARFLGGRLVLFGYLVGGLVTGLALSAILIRWCSIRSTPTPTGRRERQKLLPLVLALVVVLFWTAVVFRIGAYYMPRTDNWYYLAEVQRISIADNLVPGDPFFKGIADTGRSGPWLAMVALWAKQSGTSLVTLWELLPALVMPVTLLAFYGLAWRLFRDQWTAALAVVLILAGRTGLMWNEPMMMAVPSYVAMLLSLVGLGLTIEYGRTGRTAYLATVLLLAVTIAAQHFLVFVGFLLALLAFAFGQLVMELVTSRLSMEEGDALKPARWRETGRRLLLVTVLAMLLAVPAFFFWSRSTANTLNPIYEDLWGLFKTIGPWHVLRVSSLSGGPHLFAFSFLLSPFLVLQVRRHDWAVFLLTMMVLVVLIAFVPPIVELILQSHLLPPWAIWRLAVQVYPFQLTMAAFICWAARLVWPSVLSLFSGRRWLSFLIVGGLVLLALLPNATPVVEPLLKYVQMAREGRPMDDAVTWLQEGPLAALPQVKEPLVILSDVSTNFYISGLTGHYVVAIPYGHASPLVSDDQERRDQVFGLLTANGDVAAMRELVERQDVAVLVLVQAPDLGEYSLSPEAWEHWVDSLEAAGSGFTRLFYDEEEDRRAAVYLWRSDEVIP